MNKRSVGSIYEQLAAEQLINMGYSVLACNYRNRFGEIDIIAKDGDTICFCEVKYRRDNGCGRALEAVGYSKQKKPSIRASFSCKVLSYETWFG